MGWKPYSGSNIQSPNLHGACDGFARRRYGMKHYVLKVDDKIHSNYRQHNSNPIRQPEVIEKSPSVPPGQIPPTAAVGKIRRNRKLLRNTIPKLLIQLNS